MCGPQYLCTPGFKGMVELDDTYIGGKKKTAKHGRPGGARSKVPVLVVVDYRPKCCGHVTLRKVPSGISLYASNQS
jgi:hypothetical protein